MRFVLPILVALSGSAAADKVVWHRWSPPASCTLAEPIALDSSATVLRAFPDCKVHVDWRHWHLVEIVMSGENTTVRGIVSVRRHGNRVVVKVATESFCAGTHDITTWRRWIRVPATVTAASLVEAHKPDAKRCRVP